MAKVWRTKFPYLGLAASALMALIARQSVLALSQPGGITSASYFTAAVNMASTLIIPIFATIFAAMLVASEAARGTFRTVLTRPLTRGEFLTAKLLTAETYLLLLFLANILPSIAIARGFPLISPGDEDIMIPGAAEQVGIFTIALLLTFLPLAATVCFGFCVSALSSNPATAIGVAVGLLLSIEPIKHLGELGLEPWIVSSYYDTAMGIASEKADGIPATWQATKILWLLGISAATALAFLTVGYWSFLRRDLNG